MKIKNNLKRIVAVILAVALVITGYSGYSWATLHATTEETETADQGIQGDGAQEAVQADVITQEAPLQEEPVLEVLPQEDTAPTVEAVPAEDTPSAVQAEGEGQAEGEIQVVAEDSTEAEKPDTESTDKAEDEKIILTFAAGEGGKVSVSEQKLGENDSVQAVIATAEKGYKFLNWTDATGKVVSEAEEFTAEKKNESYTANFEKSDVEFKHEQKVNGVTVKIYAPAGVLPEGTTVSIVPMSLEEVKAVLEDKLNENVDEANGEAKKEVVDAVMFDITFSDKEGNEIQPNDNVKITFENIRFKNTEDIDEKALDAVVVHIDDKTPQQNVEILKEDMAPTDTKVSFENDNFSPVGAVALAADEYIYTGKCYTGFLPKTAYGAWPTNIFSLVYPDGSEKVAYCFNYDKDLPESNKYKEEFHNATNAQFQSMSARKPADLERKIKNVIYFGYPYNASKKNFFNITRTEYGIGNGDYHAGKYSDREYMQLFRIATQWAVWYYTDGYQNNLAPEYRFCYSQDMGKQAHDLAARIIQEVENTSTTAPIELDLFKPYHSNYQNLLVTRERHDIIPPVINITIPGKKTVNDQEPGNRTFTFGIWKKGEENSKPALQEVTNNAAGEFEFKNFASDIKNGDQFVIKEIPGSDGNVVYDTTEYVATAKTAADGSITFGYSTGTTQTQAVNTMISRAGTFYANGSAKNYVYVSPDKSYKNQVQAYCIQPLYEFPETVVGTRYYNYECRYTSYIDPSGNTLSRYVENNPYGNNETLRSNLSKIVYYGLKNGQPWATIEGNVYNVVAKGSRNPNLPAEIANTVVPSNFHLVLFVPQQSGRIQALISGFITGESSDVTATEVKFNNRVTETPPSTPQEYRINVKKVADDAAMSPLAGVRFELYIKETETYVDGWTTQQNTGEVSVPAASKPGLVKDVIYVLKEVQTPNGYLKVKDFEFKLGEDGLIIPESLKYTDGTPIENDDISLSNEGISLLTVKNREESKPIVISKKDLGGNEIDGAKIEIWKGQNKIADWTSTNQPHELTLTAGEYIFKETYAPGAYVAVTDITFTVGTDGTVAVKNAAGNTVSTDGNKLIVTDQYAKTSISLLKVDESGEKLQGVEFTLSGGMENQTYTATSDLNGRVLFDNIPFGRYKLRETKATGYNIPAILAVGYDFVVSRNTRTGRTEITELGIGDSGITVNFNQEFNLKIVNESESKPVQISKVSLGGTEIAGAEIEIYSGESVTGTPVQKWRSAAGTTKEIKLAPGTYTFHEITAPTGYEVVTDITFKVAADGTVTVTNKNGNTVSASGSKLTVTDQYTPISTTLEAAKTLTGKELKDNDFTFTLTGKSTNAQGVAQEKKNTGTKVTFDELTYNATGDYVYEVKETAGNAGGVTYDTSVYTVTVKVTEGRDGLVLAKEIKKNGQRADAISFVNNYAPAATSLDLTAKKVLEGKALENEMFTFTLEGDNVKQTKKNDAQGNITFDTLNYTKAGTYTYTVKETAGNAGGISYDGSVYTVTVKVTDDGKGNLKAEKPEITVTKEGTSQTAREITFTNSYSTKDVKAMLQANKSLIAPTGSPRALKEGEFSFNLKGESVDETVTNDATGNVSFSEITYKKAGTYNYTIKEVKGNAAGVTYAENTVQVVVVVEDDGNGALTTTVTYDGKEAEPTFTNTYKPAETEISLEATKTLEGKELKEGMFEFTLTGNGVGQTKKNDAQGKVTFDKLRFTEAGTYIYTVKETAGNAGGIKYDGAVYTVKVVVTDNEEGQLEAVKTITKDEKEVKAITFENTYSTKDAAVTLRANKTLSVPDGSPRKLQEGEFEFTLQGNNNGVITNETKACDAAGNVSFSEIAYKKAGTYNYTIKEVKGKAAGVTYAENTVQVNVVVADDGNGALTTTVTYDGKEAEPTFTNSYTPAATEISLNAVKTLEGKELTAEMFEFTLTGTGVDQTKKNDAQGNVTFDKLIFAKAGTYTYTVKETAGQAGGISYDGAIYTVTVEVTDNGNGQLVATKNISKSENGNNTPVTAISFENTYSTTDAAVTLRANKNLSVPQGSTRVIKAGEFEFTLTGDNDGVKVDETKACDAAGNVSFSAITYKTAGIYNYTIKEVKGNAAGVTYAENTVEVQVVVADDGNGALTTTVTYDGKEAEPTFTNTYKPAETEISLEATKTLEGKGLRKDMFEFTLTGNGADQTKTNDAQGKVTFDKLSFAKAGTYIYTVKETAGQAGGISYDGSVYTVTVDVTDDGNGHLVATKSISKAGAAANEITFANTYTTGEISVNLQAQKKLTVPQGSPRVIKAGEFNFTLAGDNDGVKVEETKACEANGNVSFSEITYKKAGTYNYTIKEVKGKAAGVTYADKTVNVKVVVTDNGGGTLSAVTTYDDTAAVPIFTNSYAPAATEISLNAVKTLEGKELTAEMFEFTLTGNGVDQTKKNDAQGNVTFDKLIFAKAGTYTYTVKETAGQAGGISYDGAIYTVTVEVKDNGEGQLVATKSISKAGAATTDAIAFENTYTTGEIKVNLQAQKKLTVPQGSTRVIKAGEFNFTLAGDNDGVKVDETKACDADGNISFSEITYQNAGTYNYTITEVKGTVSGITYDTTEVAVKVVVTDNGDGTLSAVTTYDDEATVPTFTNSYAPAETEISLSAAKTLEGRTLTAEMFEFTLTGNGADQTKKNDAQGSVTFDKLRFTEAGTYIYTVKETAGNAGGISYDGSVYTVTVDVTDDGNGHLVAAKSISKAGAAANEIAFANTYTTGEISVNLQAQKELSVPQGSPRVIGEGEFSFTLKGEGVDETKTCDAAGNVSFSEITYQNAGTYNYTITEVKGTVSGITYDAREVAVKVVVTDNGDGTLSAVTTYDDAAEVPAFTNTYTPGSARLSLGATKEMIGRDLRAGEFEFTLSENGTVLQTKTNAVDGKITFDEIAYDQAGDYTYTIAEVNKGTSGVYYDRSVFETTVTVTDDGSGQLTAVADTTKNGASVTGADFVNNAISFIVNKTDITGSEEVEGAEISIFEADADGAKTGDAIGKWTSKKGEAHDFGPILKPNGKYVLSETVTPEGYKAIADTVFTVDENGKVTSELPKVSVVTATGERVEQNLVRNELSEQAVSFSKQNMTGEELIGATIEVRKAGETRAVETWKSDGSVHEFKLLPGEYEFVETAAPEGYKLATNIRFTVDKEGVLQVTSADTTVLKTDPTNDKQVIVMVDELKDRPNEDRGGKEYPVKFSKQDLLGEELKGATIVLRNADNGTQIETWKSDGTVKEFTVKPGNYQFIETAAPEGYKLATEINFTVTEDGKLNVTSSNVQVLNEGQTGEEIIVMIDEFESDTPTTPQGGEEKPKDNVVEPRGNTETPKTTKTSKSPITGDEATALLWLLLMGMGAAGVVIIVRNRKKEEKEN